MASRVPEKANVAVRAPIADGENWTLIEQLLCAASVAPQVLGGSRKSPGCKPVMLKLKLVGEL